VNRTACFTFLIFLGLLSTARADELGRLFFTPAERKQLELQHALKPGNSDQAPSIVTVNGVIKRSDGSRIVWINGKAQQLTPSGNSDKIPVTVPGKKKPLEVKVGERIFLDTPLRQNSEPSPSSDNE
jgi:hypothetical protein